MSRAWSISSNYAEQKLKDFHFKCPSGQLNGNLILLFMIRWKHYKKKIIIWGNISLVIARILESLAGSLVFLVIAIWADIFIAYIALNRISTCLPQFYPGDLANFAGSTIIFFFIVGVIIR